MDGVRLEPLAPHHLDAVTPRLLTEWAFAEAGAQRIQLVIDVENPGSRRVAERCGYVLEGVMRSVAFKNGRRIDVELWSRLPSDPAPD
jgi:RimJ/RimL family protein N-acetyltransferase